MDKAPVVSTILSIDERVELICSIGEEVITKQELYKLLETKCDKPIYAYDGFEPSGKMHIAQGLLRTHNVNKLTRAGIKFKFWIADWFAQMNLKLGGDIEKIKQAGLEMINIWNACGMDMENVEFIWSSDEINSRTSEYWKLVIDISSKFNINRITKCTQIMGRNETDELATSQILYPVMQCADVFFLGIDICSLGMDQRKVNMLALEYCDKIKATQKPIIVSHNMLMGLDGSNKMSKSNPDNCIFMDDKEPEIKRKIKKAFCEAGNIEKNPILNWIKYMIIPICGKFTIIENLKWNELQIIYYNYPDLEQDFKNLKIHPKRIKDSVVKQITDLLTPIQEKLGLTK
jgi:tyrosyl-tRNA synthetase